MVTELLQRLPKTYHNLEKAEEFLLDAFQRASPQAPWFHISVHGEFKGKNEKCGKDIVSLRGPYLQLDEANTLYSFDRSFILQPAVHGSP